MRKLITTSTLALTLGLGGALALPVSAAQAAPLSYTLTFGASNEPAAHKKCTDKTGQINRSSTMRVTKPCYWAGWKLGSNGQYTYYYKLGVTRLV